MVRQHKLSKIKELEYEWRLVKGNSNELCKSGKGKIRLHRWWILSEQSKAIVLKRISEQEQYRLQIRIIDNKDTSPYMDMLEFTIKDKDDYGMNLLWVIVSALIGAVVGAIIGTSV
jgi:hypothetical protein